MLRPFLISKCKYILFLFAKSKFYTIFAPCIYLQDNEYYKFSKTSIRASDEGFG